MNDADRTKQLKRDAITAVRYGHGDSWYAVERYIDEVVRAPLQSRLQAYETAVRELVTSSEEVYFGCPPEVADRYNDAYARLRELSSQEGAG